MWHHVIDYFVLKPCLCYIVHSTESHQLCSFCSVHHKTTKRFQHFEEHCLFRFPLRQCLFAYNSKLKEYFQGSISLIIGNTIVLKGLLFMCVLCIHLSMNGSVVRSSIQWSIWEFTETESQWQQPQTLLRGAPRGENVLVSKNRSIIQRGTVNQLPPHIFTINMDSSLMCGRRADNRRSMCLFRAFKVDRSL